LERRVQLRSDGDRRAWSRRGVVDDFLRFFRRRSIEDADDTLVKLVLLGLEDWIDRWAGGRISKAIGNKICTRTFITVCLE
jgi:hypothetical protein